MKLPNKIRNYINDYDFKITILKNKINICNYTKISYLDNDKISIKYQEGEIHIKGENLSASKLLNNEILITGKIKNIEMR